MTLTEVHIRYDPKDKGQESKDSQGDRGHWFRLDCRWMTVNSDSELGLQRAEAVGSRRVVNRSTVAC